MSEQVFELASGSIYNSKDLLIYLRVVSSTNKQLLEDVLREKVQFDEKGFLNDENEIEMLRFLLIRCKLLLRGYSTSIEVFFFFFFLNNWKMCGNLFFFF